MAVFCSDHIADGFRMPLYREPERTTFSCGDRVFHWDGTYDENGDARFRERTVQTTTRSSSS
jgi:hypothetical protein